MLPRLNRCTYQLFTVHSDNDIGRSKGKERRHCALRLCGSKHGVHAASQFSDSTGTEACGGQNIFTVNALHTFIVSFMFYHQSVTE